MNKTRFFSLFLLVLLLTSFISGCSGVSRIDDFFSNDEYQQHSKIIDFALFFVMFFALSFLGLTKVWGEGYGKAGSGKGAIVALSIALSLALAFALVTQTRFSITTIFPMAKAVFFLIMTFLLAGLIIHSKVFGDTKMAKVIAFVISAIAMYLIFSIGTHMVCQMSDNMDDPACKSDFFNAMFTLLGRWFGIDSWTSEGGSGGSGGTGGTGAGGTGAGGTGSTNSNTTTTGTVEGGCRLDITFDVGSATSMTSSAPIADYVKSVKAMGKTKVHVFGYASMEGNERYNFGLGGARGRTIADMIKAADPSISASVSSGGPTDVFDASNYQPNRRVVVVTENIGDSVMPAPDPFSPVNCPTPTTPQVCGDQVIEGTEECDGNSDDKCPKACMKNCTCPVAATTTTPGVIPATCKNKMIDAGEECDSSVAGSCPTGEHCADDCSKCLPGPAAVPPKNAGSGGWWSNWYLLLLIAIIPLLLLAFRGGYNKYQKWFHAADPKDITDRLLKLIKLARAKMIALGQMIPPGLPPDDTTRFAFKAAVRGKGPLKTDLGLKKRIVNRLGKRQPDGSLFAESVLGGEVGNKHSPNPKRQEFIDTLYDCVNAIHKAIRLIDKSWVYYFWPEALSLRRLEKKLEKAVVSPVVRHDKRVTFMYSNPQHLKGTVDSADVLIQSAGATNAYPMERVDSRKNVWSVTTPKPLANGDYRYLFRIVFVNSTGSKLRPVNLRDPRNRKMVMDGNVAWNIVTVRDIVHDVEAVPLPTDARYMIILR